MKSNVSVFRPLSMLGLALLIPCLSRAGQSQGVAAIKGYLLTQVTKMEAASDDSVAF